MFPQHTFVPGAIEELIYVTIAHTRRMWRNAVQEVCSPSRSTFMTGRFPLHTGLDSWIPNEDTYGVSVFAAPAVASAAAVVVVVVALPFPVAAVNGAVGDAGAGAAWLVIAVVIVVVVVDAACPLYV